MLCDRCEEPLIEIDARSNGQYELALKGMARRDWHALPNFLVIGGSFGFETEPIRL